MRLGKPTMRFHVFPRSWQGYQDSCHWVTPDNDATITQELCQSKDKELKVDYNEFRAPKYKLRTTYALLLCKLFHMNINTVTLINESAPA